VVFPRHIAPIKAGENLQGQGAHVRRRGDVRHRHAQPDARPVRHIGFQSNPFELVPGRTPFDTQFSQSAGNAVITSVTGRQMSDSEILSRCHSSSVDLTGCFFSTSKTSGSSTAPASGNPVVGCVPPADDQVNFIPLRQQLFQLRGKTFGARRTFNPGNFFYHACYNSANIRSTNGPRHDAKMAGCPP